MIHFQHFYTARSLISVVEFLLSSAIRIEVVVGRGEAWSGMRRLLLGNVGLPSSAICEGYFFTDNPSLFLSRPSSGLLSVNKEECLSSPPAALEHIMALNCEIFKLDGPVDVCMRMFS